MRHRNAGRKLGRTSSHKKAMLRNMVTSFLKEEKIITTDAKAKELRSLADKIITLGKEGTLHARRLAMQVVRDKTTAKKIFDDLSARFKDRNGGYTRIVKVGNRVGDNAPISMIELVDRPEEKKTKEKKAKAGSKTKKGAAKKTETKKAEGKKTERKKAEPKKAKAEKDESKKEEPKKKTRKAAEKES
jgi:large subunit ribosomal protein L17